MIPQHEFSGQIMDVVSGRIYPGTITISDGHINSIKPGEVKETHFILPGLIDAHIHIESSMLIPSEFARLAVVHGTTGTVSDPHEIANVLGLDGIEFMIRNGKLTPFHFYFGAPSCVPATSFESSGSVIGPEDVEKLLSDNEISYLSEMMNFPGVVYDDPDVAAKLSSAHKNGKPVDGHAPGLFGKLLEKYVNAGISTDHECTTLEEAHEKLALGMHILIREGSAARNFDTLIPLLRTHPDNVMLCSDDKHPDDLVKGHLNHLLQKAISLGYDPIAAIRACTLNPVNHYRLNAGLLRVGDPADLIIVDNLESFNVLATYITGKLVALEGKTLLKTAETNKPNKFCVQEVTEENLKIPEQKGLIQVIQAYSGELVTGRLELEPKIENGYVTSDPDRDILKIAVINRYKPSTPALGFIRGFGLTNGALASTVAHDSHNLICVGVTDEEMVQAISMVMACKGGIAAVNGSSTELLPLPVAGIMTDQDGFRVAKQYEDINTKVQQMGSKLRAPFMTLSFMALLVIPELKLSDKGLFNGNAFEFTDLFLAK